jgi:hypothetical protein
MMNENYRHELEREEPSFSLFLSDGQKVSERLIFILLRGFASKVGKTVLEESGA